MTVHHIARICTYTHMMYEVYCRALRYDVCIVIDIVFAPRMESGLSRPFGVHILIHIPQRHVVSFFLSFSLLLNCLFVFARPNYQLYSHQSPFIISTLMMPALCGPPRLLCRRRRRETLNYAI